MPLLNPKFWQRWKRKYALSRLHQKNNAVIQKDKRSVAILGDKRADAILEEKRSVAVLKEKRTVAVLKEKRTVPEHVQEARKKYTRIRKTLMEALKGEEGKTIPQLAEITGLDPSETTYYLMTLLKFGDVAVEGVDDMDEYYLYKLKNA
jgi:hypothetical protein